MLKTTKIDSWTCANCDKECERPVTKGQRPRWCSRRCADLAKRGVTRECDHCGKTYRGMGERFCGRSCASSSAARKQVRPKAQPKVQRGPRDTRGPFRRAYEEHDWPALAAYIRENVNVEDGCWIWQRRIKRGYPLAQAGSKWIAVHRLSVEAHAAKPLGSQPVHHECADTRCVNPEHLSPVTHRENVAEMLARKAYVARIRELEEALAQFDPGHPLLMVLPIM